MYSSRCEALKHEGREGDWSHKQLPGHSGPPEPPKTLELQLPARRLGIGTARQKVDKLELGL